jgi:hypothetical protein
VGGGHPGEPDSGHLGKLLEREQAEAAAPDHPETDLIIDHGPRPQA